MIFRENGLFSEILVWARSRLSKIDQWTLSYTRLHSSMHKNLKFVVSPEFYIVLLVLILVNFRFLLDFTFSFVCLIVISRKIAICAVPNNYEPCLIKQEDAVPNNYKPCLIKQKDVLIKKKLC